VGDSKVLADSSNIMVEYQRREVFVKRVSEALKKRCVCGGGEGGGVHLQLRGVLGDVPEAAPLGTQPMWVAVGRPVRSHGGGVTGGHAV